MTMTARRLLGLPPDKTSAKMQSDRYHIHSCSKESFELPI